MPSSRPVVTNRTLHTIITSSTPAKEPTAKKKKSKNKNKSKDKDAATTPGVPAAEKGGSTGVFSSTHNQQQSQPSGSNATMTSSPTAAVAASNNGSGSSTADVSVSLPPDSTAQSTSHNDRRVSTSNSGVVDDPALPPSLPNTSVHAGGDGGSNHMVNHGRRGSGAPQVQEAATAMVLATQQQQRNGNNGNSNSKNASMGPHPSQQPQHLLSSPVMPPPPPPPFYDFLETLPTYIETCLMPTPEDRRQRERLFADIQAVTRRALKNDRVEVRVHGSVTTALALPSSDIDLLVVGYQPVPPLEALHTLAQALRDVNEEGLAEAVQHQMETEARQTALDDDGDDTIEEGAAGEEGKGRETATRKQRQGQDAGGTAPTASTSVTNSASPIGNNTGDRVEDEERGEDSGDAAAGREGSSRRRGSDGNSDSKNGANSANVSCEGLQPLGPDDEKGLSLLTPPSSSDEVGKGPEGHGEETAGSGGALSRTQASKATAVATAAADNDDALEHYKDQEDLENAEETYRSQIEKDYSFSTPYASATVAALNKGFENQGLLHATVYGGGGSGDGKTSMGSSARERFTAAAVSVSSSTSPPSVAIAPTITAMVEEEAVRLGASGSGGDNKHKKGDGIHDRHSGSLRQQAIGSDGVGLEVVTGGGGGAELGASTPCSPSLNLSLMKTPLRQESQQQQQQLQKTAVHDERNEKWEGVLSTSQVQQSCGPTATTAIVPSASTAAQLSQQVPPILSSQQQQQQYGYIHAGQQDTRGGATVTTGAQWNLKYVPIYEGPLYRVQAIVSTRVPVIKIVEKATGMKADITFAGGEHWRSMQLTRQLLDTLPQARPLILFLKHCVRSLSIGENEPGGVTSFAIYLMVRHFFNECKRRVTAILLHREKFLLAQQRMLDAERAQRAALVREAEAAVASTSPPTPSLPRSYEQGQQLVQDALAREERPALRATEEEATRLPQVNALPQGSQAPCQSDSTQQQQLQQKQQKQEDGAEEGEEPQQSLPTVESLLENYLLIRLNSSAQRQQQQRQRQQQQRQRQHADGSGNATTTSTDVGEAAAVSLPPSNEDKLGRLRPIQQSILAFLGPVNSPLSVSAADAKGARATVRTATGGGGADGGRVTPSPTCLYAEEGTDGGGAMPPALGAGTGQVAMKEVEPPTATVLVTPGKDEKDSTAAATAHTSIVSTVVVERRESPLPSPSRSATTSPVAAPFSPSTASVEAVDEKREEAHGGTSISRSDKDGAQGASSSAEEPQKAREEHKHEATVSTEQQQRDGEGVPKDAAEARENARDGDNDDTEQQRAQEKQHLEDIMNFAEDFLRHRVSLSQLFTDFCTYFGCTFNYDTDGIRFHLDGSSVVVKKPALCARRGQHFHMTSPFDPEYDLTARMTFMREFQWVCWWFATYAVTSYPPSCTLQYVTQWLSPQTAEADVMAVHQRLYQQYSLFNLERQRQQQQQQWPAQRAQGSSKLDSGSDRKTSSPVFPTEPIALQQQQQQQLTATAGPPSPLRAGERRSSPLEKQSGFFGNASGGETNALHDSQPNRDADGADLQQPQQQQQPSPPHGSVNSSPTSRTLAGALSNVASQQALSSEPITPASLPPTSQQQQQQQQSKQRLASSPNASAAVPLLEAAVVEDDHHKESSKNENSEQHGRQWTEEEAVQEKSGHAEPHQIPSLQTDEKANKGEDVLLSEDSVPSLPTTVPFFSHQPQRQQPFSMRSGDGAMMMGEPSPTLSSAAAAASAYNYYAACAAAAVPQFVDMYSLYAPQPFANLPHTPHQQHQRNHHHGNGIGGGGKNRAHMIHHHHHHPLYGAGGIPAGVGLMPVPRNSYEAEQQQQYMWAAAAAAAASQQQQQRQQQLMMYMMMNANEAAAANGVGTRSGAPSPAPSSASPLATTMGASTMGGRGGGMGSGHPTPFPQQQQMGVAGGGGHETAYFHGPQSYDPRQLAFYRQQMYLQNRQQNKAENERRKQQQQQQGRATSPSATTPTAVAAAVPSPTPFSLLEKRSKPLRSRTTSSSSRANVISPTSDHIPVSSYLRPGNDSGVPQEGARKDSNVGAEGREATANREAHGKTATAVVVGEGEKEQAQQSTEAATTAAATGKAKKTKGRSHSYDDGAVLATRGHSASSNHKKKAQSAFNPPQQQQQQQVRSASAIYPPQLHHHHSSPNVHHYHSSSNHSNGNTGDSSLPYAPAAAAAILAATQPQRQHSSPVPQPQASAGQAVPSATYGAFRSPFQLHQQQQQQQQPHFYAAYQLQQPSAAAAAYFDPVLQHHHQQQQRGHVGPVASGGGGAFFTAPAPPHSDPRGVAESSGSAVDAPRPRSATRDSNE